MMKTLASLALSCLVPAGWLALPAPAAAEGELTVASWSGSYLRSQMLGSIGPFEKATGIDVEVVSYTGGIEEIREQVYARNVKWDVVDLELFDAIRADKEGLLAEIAVDSLPPAPDGTPAREDFLEGTLFDFGAGSIVFSTVIAYDRERVGEAPAEMEAFFDLERYPGRRGLRRTPKVNLEWALLADGVSPDRVYPLLETEAGLDRAFAVLDRIKPQIVWWERGLEAVRMLQRDEVLMASAWSGRVFTAQQRGVPLEILWDRQIWHLDVWSVVKHTENRREAMRFVRYATSTESLARQARHIPYGPVRRSSLAMVPGATRTRLPTAPENTATAFEADARWWAEHLDRIEPRFERWIDQPVMVPKELTR